MAKCIYIYSRKILPVSTHAILNKICDKLTPDNIIPTKHKVMVNGQVAYAILNPTKTLLEKDNSLLLGQIFSKNENWNIPLTEFPDGSYALFRNGQECCEVVSDSVASRTIWHYKDENFFVASTSQRAINMFIESFEFDERIIPWMLSTGSLGPTFSWDKRIKRIPADSSAILNKVNWSVSYKSNPIEFNAVKRSEKEHKKNLRESLRATFKSLDIDYSYWALPLSGGYDSRGILCLLSENTNTHDLRTLTWGLESSINSKGNDAYVAKELARQLNVSHKYYHTDLSKESIDIIINRFVLLGEGRIDHLSGYMDGFKIWKTLFEDGVEGIIRGDESFGWLAVSSATDVRFSLSCTLCSDFSNLKDYLKYKFPSQEVPHYLNQKKNETFAVWRDRLYQEYRASTILSALSDLKFSYVEQISPFFSKEILHCVRELPDKLRSEKSLFKKIVTSIGPKIDFATKDATASPGSILQQKYLVEFLRNELSSSNAKGILPGEFLDFILKGLKTEEKTISANSFSVKSFAKKHLPPFLKNAIRRISPPNVNHNTLAFRSFLIVKMNSILNEDISINRQ